MAISEAVKSGNMGYQAAVQQINKLLTPAEENAVLEVESSFWGAMRGFQEPQRIAVSDMNVQVDPAHFLLFLFYDMPQAMGK